MSPQHKKILLVDDEERLLSGLRRRLSGAFDIVTAVSGPIALDLIDQDGSIAVVVADMQMPEMNGIELLKAIKFKAPAIRRLMLTGNADEETAIAAINEGQVMRFLRKPCEIEELKSALHQALEEYSFQSIDPIPETQTAGLADRGEIARNAFLAMMNHELRTPLNHIIGFASILEANQADKEDTEASEFLKNIQHSGEQLLTLVNRILTFSQLQSATSTQMDCERVEILELIHEEVDRIRKDAGEKHVTISVDSLRRRINISAREDDARLALKELLSNAVKFVSTGGHISVLVKCDKSKVAVKIMDNGCGIPEDLLSSINAPFRQADEKRSRQHEGIGLGLALVSTIAKLNNAAFQIDNQSGGGAAATLILQRPMCESENIQIKSSA